MSQKQYGALEQHVINVFLRDKVFNFYSMDYNVLIACKPRPSAGECKTDVYVLGENKNGGRIELKISVKSEGTNEFQENKVNSEKAEAYFGTDWASIVCRATMDIKRAFEERPLIYISGRHPTKPNSITLGWKLEIANKPRALSVKAPLNNQETRNFVYKGTNQNDDKRNARVNGVPTYNAGVADYLLVTSVAKINNVEDIISELEPIDFANLPETYLIFTANNYRTDVDSADGPRPLAVYVIWECVNNKLYHTIKYDRPLAYTGENDIKPVLIKALRQLGKRNPSDFNIKADLPSSDIVCY